MTSRRCACTRSSASSSRERRRSTRSATASSSTPIAWRACAESDQVAHVGVDRERLAGDAAARLAAKEERHVGDVLRADGGMQARGFEKPVAEFLMAHAVRLGLRRDDTLDALALDDAG